MATWTDGAAYAPIERPDGFATPEVAPLPAAEVRQPLTPGAIAPPHDFAPMPQSMPLAALGAREPQRRNPAAPFDVASALLTASPAGVGARDPHQPFAVSTAAGHLPASGGPSDGMAPPDPGSRIDLQPNGPGPYPPQHNTADQPLSAAQQLFFFIAGVAFLLGALLFMAMPWLLLGGGGLLLRTNKVGRQIGTAALVTGVLMGIAVLAKSDFLLTGLGRWATLALGIGCLATGFNQARR